MYSELEIEGVGKYWVDDSYNSTQGNGWRAVFGDGLTVPYTLIGHYTGRIITNLDTGFYLETKNINQLPIVLYGRHSDLDGLAKALSASLGPRESVWIKGFGLTKARYYAGARCNAVDYYRYFVFDDRGWCNHIHYSQTVLHDSVTAEPF